MTGRPDVTVLRGRGMAVLSGDKALDLINQAGCTRDASFSGWLVDLAELPRRLHTIATARGWTLVEHPWAAKP